MRTRGLLSALMCAALLGGTPGAASAQGLRVMEGSVAGALEVPMNRAVVVESETPFGELSIANPNIADISTLSDRTIYVLGKTPGRTTLTLLSPEGALITNVDVRVTPEIGEFKERLRQILPGEHIEVRTANDGLVLSGRVSNVVALDRALDLAERYAPGRVSNLLTVAGSQQVMLKVRFAEMNRSVTKSLGTSIATAGTFGNGEVGVVGGSGNFATDIGPDTFAGGAVEVDPGNQGSLVLGFGVGDLAFRVLLEALESKGLVRTLAEPNLVALSGQEASFLAGGEYPIPVAGEDNTVEIEFKPFGVELTFTPTVLDADVVNLQLDAAVSSVDPTIVIQNGGFSVNAFQVRRSTTTVQLRDGESFAIAGLLQDDFQDSVAAVPFLGDLPVLGTLFRSASYQRDQSELVVIITPHLVSAVRGEALALPTDRIRLPTERDLFLGGRLQGEAGGPVGEVARQDFRGSYGYVME